MRENKNTAGGRRNYEREMEHTIASHEAAGIVPSLFLHSCCAPCSSYVLERLASHFHITVYYYNPNIDPPEEYEERAAEVERLIAELPVQYPIRFVKGAYRPEEFYEAVKGHEADPEGGERCKRCFTKRLMQTAKLAAEGGYDYFTTTLSISPLKDAALLNEIGEQAGEAWGVRYLNSDFKKKDGYKRSTQLSEEYHLYRQNYCGCIFSKEESKSRDSASKTK